MNKLKFFLAVIAFGIVLPSFVSIQELPSPQSLVVTLTGYKDANDALKCKLFYMATLPEDPSVIKSVHLVLEKTLDLGETEKVSDIIVPFDWAAAQKIDGVVSFYTTRNILYIGIGEYDLLRKYECKIAFLDEFGNESRFAVYRN